MTNREWSTIFIALLIVLSACCFVGYKAGKADGWNAGYRQGYDDCYHFYSRGK